LFAQQATTVGIDIAKDTFKLDDGTVVKASLHDTAGQERYRAITTTFYREADGAMLVYDCTLPQSLHGCSTWLKELRLSAPADIPVILVGNKADRSNRAVPQEEGLAFADQHKLAFAETSALDGSGVRTAFTALLTQAHRMRSAREAAAAGGAGGAASATKAGVVTPKAEVDPTSGCCS
jgi:Ras-related protein Rab-11A/Ras-related protein Rab-11B